VLTVLQVALTPTSLVSQDYLLKENVSYYPESHSSSKDGYVSERCKLDIYYPQKPKKAFPTLVWFHGGGLTGGEKHIPEGLKNQGIAVVTVNYRLHPKVKNPAYIEDAAAAVAWVINNIEDFGGDKDTIFLSGHSAGGYLASMVGLDKKWLASHSIDANLLAGLIPLSGHTITHFTIRKENGLAHTQPVVDEYAPLFHVRADAPPLLLITGDRELELWGRYEENAFMMRMMKVAGHKQTQIMELDGYDHGMVEPAIPLVLNQMNKILKK
jgi:acetyl esterase/lipase